MRFTQEHTRAIEIADMVRPDGRSSSKEPLVWSEKYKAHLHPSWDEKAEVYRARFKPSFTTLHEMYRVGDRLLTRQQIWEERIPHILKPEPLTKYMSASPEEVRRWADQLLKWQQTVETYVASPEVQLAKLQTNSTKSLKAAQKKLNFVSSALHVWQLFLSFTPEERQELRKSLDERGAFVWAQLEAADNAVIQAYPDATERADALAGANTAIGRLALDGDAYAAGAARNRVLANRKSGRKVAEQLKLTQVEAFKALEARMVTNPKRLVRSRLVVPRCADLLVKGCKREKIDDNDSQIQ